MNELKICRKQMNFVRTFERLFLCKISMNNSCILDVNNLDNILFHFQQKYKRIDFTVSRYKSRIAVSFDQLCLITLIIFVCFDRYCGICDLPNIYFTLQSQMWIAVGHLLPLLLEHFSGSPLRVLYLTSGDRRPKER